MQNVSLLPWGVCAFATVPEDLSSRLLGSLKDYGHFVETSSTWSGQ